jgi:hypothetical protein
VKRLLAIIVLVYSTVHVHAFQETELPGTAAPIDRSVSPQAQLALPDAGAAKEEGTSITIPGLGKIGTLPKLDFGLELLYKDDDTQPVDQLDDDGLAIKGRLKHSF